MLKTRPCRTGRQLLLPRQPGKQKAPAQSDQAILGFRQTKSNKDFVKLDKTKILFEGEPFRCTRIRRLPTRTYLLIVLLTHNHNLNPSEARIRDLPTNQSVTYPNKTTAAHAYYPFSSFTVLRNIALSSA
jgi:hypothetical protein